MGEEGQEEKELEGSSCREDVVQKYFFCIVNEPHKRVCTRVFFYYYYEIIMVLL
jgi:hypothetical protein